MIVLSRKRDESIIINDDIVITVVDIRGDKVRLGIEAPIQMPLHRGEVHEAIRRGQESAATRRRESLAAQIAEMRRMLDEMEGRLSSVS